MKCIIWFLVLVSHASSWAELPVVQASKLMQDIYMNDSWGEVILTGGVVRSFKVESIRDEVFDVVEVYGTFQRRHTTYLLSDIQSLREIGPRHIQTRTALFRESKSVPIALLSELIIPGTGYLYIGQRDQARSLFSFIGIMVSTAYVTGRDAAVGWLPLLSWVKIASLLQLYDKIDAMNKNSVSFDVGMTKYSSRDDLPLGFQMHLRF